MLGDLLTYNGLLRVCAEGSMDYLSSFWPSAALNPKPKGFGFRVPQAQVFVQLTIVRVVSMERSSGPNPQVPLSQTLGFRV